MSRRLFLVVFVLCLLGCTSFAGAAGAARFYMPDYGGSDPERIGGFDLGADGSLAPVPGSPFVAAEPGRGGLWGIAFTPDGSRAVTGYFFTGGVQAYRVPASGIFELAGATPTSSATGVAITPDGRFAFATTREFMSMPAEGVRRFSIGADGSLTSLGPPAPLSGDSYDLAITPDARFLFAGVGNQIERFSIGADGSLTPLGSAPALGVSHLGASPDGRFLFAEVVGGIASYAIGADGSLAQVGAPAPTAEPSIRIFAVAPDGRHLYFPDRNEDLIETVAIAPDGTPSLVGTGVPMEDPEAISVSPDGRFLVFYRGGGSDNAIGVAALGADGVPSVLPFETPWNSGEPERIVFQPQPAPVAKFAINPAAPGQAAGFDAGGSSRAARYDWDFGDGTTLANGGPAPTHVYANPGNYKVTLTVTDASGCSSRQMYTGQSTVCPGGTGTTASVTLDTLPVLGPVKAVPRKFMPKVKVKGAKPSKAKRGTTFRYSVNEAGTVSFKIERKVRRVPIKRCKPKRCSFRFKLLGSRSQAAKAGANKLKWNGKLKGKPLRPGAYRATVVATDQVGGRSTPKTVGFRILPLPKQP